MPADLQPFINQIGIPLLGLIPSNDELTKFEYTGRPLVELPEDSPVYQAVLGMMGEILR
jgi:CO dehydrogenase nickel-insertion accessory protein CooC1